MDFNNHATKHVCFVNNRKIEAIPASSEQQTSTCINIQKSYSQYISIQYDNYLS